MTCIDERFQKAQMNAGAQPIPVIDLFAGPGGLGEGFSSIFEDGRRCYRSVLSIEKEASAHQTLQLRAFFRLFPYGQAPDEYYQLARGEITLQQLYAAYPERAKQASHEAWCVELGESAVSEVRSRIETALGVADPWVLLGGPPCQPFSLAGRSRNNKGTRYSDGKETRHQLYVEYLQIIADFWPAVFVMENVRGLLTAKYAGVRMFDRIVEDLHDPAGAIERIPGRNRLRRGIKHRYTLYPIADHKYQDSTTDYIHDYIVKSELHGVPQARHRLIVVGVRDDIAVGPKPLSFSAEVSAGKVLSGLPSLRSGLSKNDDAQAWRRTIEKAGTSDWLKRLKKSDEKTVQRIEESIHNLVDSKHGRGDGFLRGKPTVGYAPEWYLDKRIGGVCNHQTRAHMASDLHRYLFASSFADVHGRSPKLSDFPRRLLPDHLSVWQALSGNYFADRFRVQLAGRPSTTVVSHIAKDGHYYIHPDSSQCRSLTVREAARLQTFPDNYLFLGNRTQQYTQVGNAVPPLLAKQIAGAVREMLVRGGKL